MGRLEIIMPSSGHFGFIDFLTWKGRQERPSLLWDICEAWTFSVKTIGEKRNGMS
jgi:hypothetical protein